ncbi:MAG: ATP-binding cassette domain-containing protein [Candidatus Promineifilaceae bacterium]|nr:ATP-binding cassette domain-containing protein [Candidatus Promineifilaceae bacterium]
MIEVTHLSKAFGPVQAVQDVTFTAPDGLITGLLGPNGAGKSTTMRVIAGTLEPDSGRATIDGFDTHSHTVEAQSRIGVLPDKRGLYQRMTARENIRYFGRLHDLKGADLESRIDQLVTLLDMSEIADRRTEGFSTGEKVKVAIARALVHKPQNIMLDEPTTGLDVMSNRSMRQVIRRLRDEGHCLLFSSHVMQEVAMLCENIVIIARGRIRIQGSAAELCQVTGQENLEDAFVSAIGTTEGLK